MFLFAIFTCLAILLLPVEGQNVWDSLSLPPPTSTGDSVLLQAAKVCTDKQAGSIKTLDALQTAFGVDAKSMAWLADGSPVWTGPTIGPAGVTGDEFCPGWSDEARKRSEGIARLRAYVGFSCGEHCGEWLGGLFEAGMRNLAVEVAGKRGWNYPGGMGVPMDRPELAESSPQICQRGEPGCSDEDGGGGGGSGDDSGDDDDSSSTSSDDDDDDNTSGSSSDDTNEDDDPDDSSDDSSADDNDSSTDDTDVDTNDPDVDDNEEPMMENPLEDPMQQCVEQEQARIWKQVGSTETAPDDIFPSEEDKESEAENLKSMGVCDIEYYGYSECQQWKKDLQSTPFESNLPDSDAEMSLCPSNLVTGKSCEQWKEDLLRTYVVTDGTLDAINKVITPGLPLPGIPHGLTVSPTRLPTVWKRQNLRRRVISRVRRSKNSWRL